MVEKAGDDTSVKYDDTEYEITVTLNDNGEGTITATADPAADTYDFTNTYTTKGEIIFSGTKTLKNRTLKEGEFSFELYDADGTLLETVSNVADGSYSFKKLDYTGTDLDKDADGNYVKTTKNYRVVETAGKDASVTYDDTEYKITVTLEDDGNGTINVTADPKESTYDFTNTYNTKGEITFSGKKTLENRTLKEGEFSFALYEMTDAREETAAAEEPIEVVSNNADGSYSFSMIEYTGEDLNKGEDGSYVETTRKYKVVEMPGQDESVTYDQKSYEITVTLNDDGNGKIITKASPEQNTYDFTNTYNTKGEITFSGTKVLKNKTLREGDFSFELYNAAGELIETVTNAADGSYSFGTIAYTGADLDKDEAGNYAETKKSYKVIEKAGSISGVEYDKKEYNITVTLKDDGRGTITAVADPAANTYEFTNTYKASGTVHFEAEKVLNGRKLTADQFTFELLDETGEVLQTKKNAEDGSVVFDEISYTEADAGKTFNYTIKEHIPEGASKNADGTWTKDSYTYDGTEHAVKVEVKDNEDGTLKITYDGKDEMDKVTFTNEYKADGTTALTAHKNLVNGTLTENLFSFELLDAEGKVLQTKGNAADGNVSFDAIKYQTQDAGKEFTYTIREKIPADAVKNDSGNWVKGDYVYDGHTVTVTVKVTDAGNGKLETATTYAGGAAAFTNTHVVTDIKKVTEDGTNLAGATLRVVDSTGKTVAEWTSDSSLKQLTGLKDGKYTLVEVSAPAGYAKAADISFTMKDGVLQGFDDGVINMVDARIRGNGGGGPSSGKDRKKPDKPTVPTRNTPDTPTGSVLGATRDVGHQVLGAVRTRPQEVLGAVRTGDTSAMLDMAAIFMAALSTLGAWFVYFFRKRREMHSN